MDYAAIIKERVSTPELFAYYGFERNRIGKVHCMFHEDRNPSMKVYDGSGGYHCFVCNANGDVIDFVQKHFHLPFRAALSKINDDFGLKLPINSYLDCETRHQMQRDAEERRRKWEAVRNEHDRLNKAYYAALDEWLRLCRQKEKYVPKTPSEPFHDLFAEALIEMVSAEEALECAETKLYLFEKNMHVRR